ncbi:hypothetical protein H0H92_008561 [Tricholoma furcatifolium]|nr:hypothetical protein H0H92_008561 [Tricholoma furcatifolium]
MPHSSPMAGLSIAVQYINPPVRDLDFSGVTMTFSGLLTKYILPARQAVTDDSITLVLALIFKSLGVGVVSAQPEDKFKMPSSLSDVVSAMSKETTNSTLGWDVVVNYSAPEMNNLLKAAYDKGHPGQLKDLSVELTLSDVTPPYKRHKIVYIFELEAPLIQFDGTAIVPACSLKIGVRGGSVITDGDPTTRVDIPQGRYRLLLSGIALNSIDGARNPTPGNKAFVFGSANTTGVVSLDIKTSLDREWLKIDLEGTSDNPIIDDQKPAIKDKIHSFLLTSPNSIHWDLAQVNNSTPSKVNGTQQLDLVPESFRFAAASVSEETGAYTILSIFIQIKDGLAGGKQDDLQPNWTTQWSKSKGYGVPPIPDQYTASIIFNNALIDKLAQKAISSPVSIYQDVPKTSSDTWGIKWILKTGQKFHMDEIFETMDHTLYRIEKEVNVDLDSADHRLTLTIGQNDGSGATSSALLDWGFSFTADWSVTPTGGSPAWGTLDVTNKLSKKKVFNNDNLAKYEVSLDAGFTSSNWNAPSYTVHGHIAGWYLFKDFLTKKIGGLQPKLPSMSLLLFDIRFFMLTNLLLPNQHVIEFAKDPGARFPRDLYLVGQVAKASVVEERLARSAA